MKRDEPSRQEGHPIAAELAQWRSEIRGFVSQITAELAALAGSPAQLQHAAAAEAGRPPAAEPGARAPAPPSGAQPAVERGPTDQSEWAREDASRNYSRRQPAFLEESPAEPSGGRNAAELPEATETGDPAEQGGAAGDRQEPSETRGSSEVGSEEPEEVEWAGPASRPVPVFGSSADRLENLRQQLAQRLRDVQHR